MIWVLILTHVLCYIIGVVIGRITKAMLINQMAVGNNSVQIGSIETEMKG